MWADILILIAAVLYLAPLYLVGRLLYFALRKLWLTHSLDEPETYGDDGGRPTYGHKLGRAGDMDPGG